MVAYLLQGPKNDSRFVVNRHHYDWYYLLVDGIYLQWLIFIQIMREHMEVIEPGVNIQFHQGLYFAMLMEGIKAIKNSYFHFRLLNDFIEHLWHLKGNK